MLTVWVIGFVISLIIDAGAYVASQKFHVYIKNYTSEHKDLTPWVLIVEALIFGAIWPIVLIITVYLKLIKRI